MVSNCANPGCAKPLHYLREGRIFIFDVPAEYGSAEAKRLHHLDHYWLCGTCSQTMTLIRGKDGIRILPKPKNREERELEWAGSAMAS